MTALALTHRPRLFTLHPGTDMTPETKIVKPFFHLRGNLRRVFMADVTGAAPGIIDKIVVALCALAGAVISMIERHRQHRLIGGVLPAISLGE